MMKRALMVKKLKASALKKKKRIRQTFDRLHVIATNLSNAARDTTGWTATLTRGTTTIRADFDEFGVARFGTISTLTTVSYVLRIRNADGDLLATRNVPADIEVFVARF
ncbi:hypothetical protein [Paenibacillus agricola]|nr:hypothetical protein [Paenibacillus agricola]